jgi:hypothetical protein
VNDTVTLADKCTEDDLFGEAVWLALHSSLLMEADHVQIALKDFATHSATIISKLVELQRLRALIRKHNAELIEQRLPSLIIPGFESQRESK